MLIKKRKCWVVATDSRQARIFEYIHADHTLIQLSIEKLSKRQAEIEAEMAQPPGGEVFDRYGSGRHITQRTKEAEYKVDRQFLRDLVEELEQAAQRNEFEQLILIAEPRSLGHLRELVKGPLRDYISDEIPLDLANAPIEEITPHVTEILYPLKT